MTVCPSTMCSASLPFFCHLCYRRSGSLFTPRPLFFGGDSLPALCSLLQAVVSRFKFGLLVCTFIDSVGFPSHRAFFFPTRDELYHFPFFFFHSSVGRLSMLPHLHPGWLFDFRFADGFAFLHVRQFFFFLICKTSPLPSNFPRSFLFVMFHT